MPVSDAVNQTRMSSPLKLVIFRMRRLGSVFLAPCSPPRSQTPFCDYSHGMGKKKNACEPRARTGKEKGGVKKKPHCNFPVLIPVNRAFQRTQAKTTSPGTWMRVSLSYTDLEVEGAVDTILLGPEDVREVFSHRAVCFFVGASPFFFSV